MSRGGGVALYRRPFVSRGRGADERVDGDGENAARERAAAVWGLLRGARGGAPGVWDGGRGMKRLFPTPEDSGQEAEKENVAEAAARWLVALDDDAVTAETRAEFERWRGADPRHAAAYQRAAAMRQALAGLA